MWRVADIELKASQLDFTSSGTREIRTVEVWADDVCLVNAANLVEYQPRALQVHVCSQCGTPECTSGGWVAFRRVGEFVAWVPAWDLMGRGDFDLNEYSPPSFMDHRGVPLFTDAAWERVRKALPAFPPASELVPLRSGDAVRALQWTAPGHIMGEFPDPPRLVQDMLIAVSDGDLGNQTRCLRVTLEAMLGEDAPVEVLVATQAHVPIEFWVDLPGYPTWAPLVRTEDGVAIRIDGGAEFALRAG